MSAHAATLPVNIYTDIGESALTSPESWKYETEHKQETDATAANDAPTMLATTNLTSFLVIPEAETEFEYLFKSASATEFEEGAESEFSRTFLFLFKKYEAVAKTILARLIEDRSISPEIAAEALRSLGTVEDPSTYQTRSWLISRALFSPSYLVRDAAVLGLESMDDTRAIPYLREALHEETIPQL